MATLFRWPPQVSTNNKRICWTNIRTWNKTLFNVFVQEWTESEYEQNVENEIKISILKMELFILAYDRD